MMRVVGRKHEGFSDTKSRTEKEDQLRWAGGFPSHASLCLLCCVTLWSSFLSVIVFRLRMRIEALLVRANGLGSGGRVCF